MMHFNRFLAWSLIVHLVIIIIGGILGTSKKNDFVVFGAHSRYSSHTQYKASRPVPFSNKKVRAPFNAKSSGGKRVGNKKQKGPRNKHKRFKQQKANNRKTKSPLQKQSSTSRRSTKKSPATKKKGKKFLPELADDLGKKKTPLLSKKKKQEPISAPEPEEEIEVVEPLIEKPLTPQKKDLTPEEPSDEEATSSDIAPADTESDSDTEHDEGFSIDGVDDPDEVAHYQRFVQEEIDRVWRPPLGVKKGTVCTVSFAIDDKGNVQTCTMTKRSAVLIYDLSIMRIARELRFHASLWGKQFKIDFCQ
ncbi:hypothetical protein FJ365_03165 [Candidatus Dependentiae bacterium]|nr:hypothetical protein [Candidatus Dependentiae bacterium]